MFRIKYKLTDSFRLDEREIPGLDSSEFRYCLFLGGFELCVGKECIATEWDNEPMLDFALSLLDIAHNLNTGMDMDTFEFSETDELMSFVRERDQVVITASYTFTTLRAPFAEFREAVNAFNKKLIFEIIELNPTLYRNRLFLTYSNLANLLK